MRGVLHAVLFALFLLRLDIIPNDDTYVYFNYARTSLEGLPFCYDGRGIPSEGFTSIVYLLLLMPFEALGLNMMFAAVLLNLIALWGILWLIEKILLCSEWLPQQAAAWAASIAWGLLLLDPHLAEIVGRGLETMLGIFAYLLASYGWLKAAKQQGSSSALLSFSISSLLSILIRPETAPPLALAGISLLFINPNKTKTLLTSLPVVALFGIYLLWKQFYFGDVFPTAFYRKLQTGHLDGYVYIRSWVLAYGPGLLLLGIGAIFYVGKYVRKRKKLPWASTPFFLFLGGTALYLLIFHRYVLPMVGYGFRHIYLVTVLLYAGLGVIIVKLFFEVETLRKGFLGIAMGALLILSLAQAWPIQLNKWRLYAEAEQAVDGFYYVQLGRFLRQHLPQHREITLIYGDAGALPYELRCRFLDTNGLSEPAIAHMFRQEAGLQKADAFADYLLARSPDLLIIAGDTAADGRVPHAITQHDPFRALRDWGHYDSEKLWAYERLKQAGFAYHHSATGYFYDLHFLIKRQSPFVAELVEALARHQAAFESYQLKQGLFFYNEKREVKFGLF